jgi:hypothetical protein
MPGVIARFDGSVVQVTLFSVSRQSEIGWNIRACLVWKKYFALIFNN